MIRIGRLEELDAASLGLITGYVSGERLEVRWGDSADRAEFLLERTRLSMSFEKRYDPPDEELLERYAKAVRSGFSLGAFDGADEVGMALAEPVEWNRSLWVWEFHVAGVRRGQGIGRLLMEELAGRATDAGLRTIVCETQSTNVPAIDFYRRMGFRIEGFDLSYYSNADWPDGEMAVFMKRRLGYP